MADACCRPRTFSPTPAKVQLFASVFLYSMSAFALAPLLPAISSHFNLPVQLQALPFSANFAGATVASIVAGYASEYVGKARVLRYALAGLAASGAAMFFAPAFGVVLAGSFTAGAFGATLQLMSVSLISDMHPQEKGYYVNLVQAFFGLGAVTGSFTAGAVLSAFDSWRAFFLLVAVVPLAIVIAFNAVRYPETPSQAASVKSLFGMLGQSSFYVPVVSLTLYVGSEIGLVSWMCIHLTNKFSVGPLYTGAVASGFWLGIALGRFMSAYLSRRFSPQSLIVANLILGSVCVMGGISSGNSLVASLLLCSTGLFYGGILPTNLVVIGTHYPQVAATALGFSLTVANVGGIALPWLLGAMARSVEVARALSLTVALNVVNAALVGGKFLCSRSRVRPG